MHLGVDHAVGASFPVHVDAVHRVAAVNTISMSRRMFYIKAGILTLAGPGRKLECAPRADAMRTVSVVWEPLGIPTQKSIRRSAPPATGTGNAGCSAIPIVLTRLRR